MERACPPAPRPPPQVRIQHPQALDFCQGIFPQIVDSGSQSLIKVPAFVLVPRVLDRATAGSACAQWAPLPGKHASPGVLRRVCHALVSQLQHINHSKKLWEAFCQQGLGSSIAQPSAAKACEWMVNGSILVAAQPDDAPDLQAQGVALQAVGVDAQWLDADELAIAEPALAPMAGGLRVATDAQLVVLAICGDLVFVDCCVFLLSRM